MTLDQLTVLVLQAGGTLTLEPLERSAGVRISAYRPGVTPLTVAASTQRPPKEMPDFVSGFAEQLEIQRFFSGSP